MLWRNLYISKPPTPCLSGYSILLHYLLQQYRNVSILPYAGSSEFYHFLLLLSADKLIEDKASTYSYWAGLLGDASEVHVDADFHPAINGPNYIYHTDGLRSPSKQFYGKYNSSEFISQTSALNFIKFESSRPVVTPQPKVMYPFPFEDIAELEKALNVDIIHFGGPMCLLLLPKYYHLCKLDRCDDRSSATMIDVIYEANSTNTISNTTSTDGRSRIELRTSTGLEPEPEPEPGSESQSKPSSNSSFGKKIVISVGHGGLGDIMSEHYFGLSVAEYMSASFYVADDSILAESLPGGGERLSSSVVHRSLLWSRIPPGHSSRISCGLQNYTLWHRDMDKARSTDEVRQRLIDFLNSDSSLGCLILVVDPTVFSLQEICEPSARYLFSPLVDQASRGSLFESVLQRNKSSNALIIASSVAGSASTSASKSISATAAASSVSRNNDEWTEMIGPVVLYDSCEEKQYGTIVYLYDMID